MVVAPGQTMQHYSPDIRSYVVLRSRYAPSFAAGGRGGGTTVELSVEERDILPCSVVVDFRGRLRSLMGGGGSNDSDDGDGSLSMALAYRDLPPSGDSAEAASKVFDAI